MSRRAEEALQVIITSTTLPDLGSNRQWQSVAGRRLLRQAKAGRRWQTLAEAGKGRAVADRGKTLLAGAGWVGGRGGGSRRSKLGSRSAEAPPPLPKAPSPSNFCFLFFFFLGVRRGKKSKVEWDIAPPLPKPPLEAPLRPPPPPPLKPPPPSPVGTTFCTLGPFWADFKNKLLAFETFTINYSVFLRLMDFLFDFKSNNLL